MALAKDQVEELVQKTLDYLGEQIHVEAAYLFGSYVDGEPHDYSDIDLAVFSPEVEALSIREQAKLFSGVKRHCHRRLELHMYPASALQKARPTNFYGYLVTHGRRVR